MSDKADIGVRRRMTRGRLIEWVQGASPALDYVAKGEAEGARLVYGHGHFAGDIASDEVNEELRRMAGQGYLYLMQGRREADGRDYIAERSKRRLPA